MDTLDLLLETASNFFQVWNSKLAVKYQSEFAELKKDFYEEKSKTVKRDGRGPDHARLDNYEFLMRNVLKRANTEFGRQNSVSGVGSD